MSTPASVRSKLARITKGVAETPSPKELRRQLVALTGLPETPTPRPKAVPVTHDPRDAKIVQLERQLAQARTKIEDLEIAVENVTKALPAFLTERNRAKRRGDELEELTDKMAALLAYTERENKIHRRTWELFKSGVEADRLEAEMKESDRQRKLTQPIWEP